ncbi:MAG: calcineurin-like phosphoesterase family protein [Odoribacteraceae bacterium]|jgi:predicted phosphodiesterase|nr:calcineurin-like phosphoesterase family protein [Odoribacteraceae bacterium]
MKTLAITLLLLLPAGADVIAQAPRVVTGHVFADLNRDGRRDRNEKGVPGVLVSNGVDVARTGRNGRYSLPLADDATIFVMKPPGYSLPLSADNLPLAHAFNKPGGSPAYIKNGIDPAPLAAPLDFPLYPAGNEETLRIGLLGDTQTRDKDEVYYVGRLVGEQLIDERFDFVVPLGDLVFDDLSMMPPLARTLGKIGVPVYPVMGNHDQNYEAREIRYRDETFKKHFGPSYYAFHYGENAFLVLNDIFPDTTAGKRGYVGRIDREQVLFVKNYLEKLDPATPLYIFMHIPVDELENPGDFFALFARHPRVMVFAGHTHTQYSLSFDRASGWPHDEPLREIVAGAVCGSWWQGDKDFFGVPSSPMEDGTPRGYWVMRLEGRERPAFEFKVSGNVPGAQMHAWTPYAFKREKLWPGKREVVVNVYAADEETVVEARAEWNGEWVAMERVLERDPYYSRVTGLRAMGIPSGENTRPLATGGGDPSRHLWRLPIPDGLPAGVHVVRVRARDAWGLDASTNVLLHVE